MNLTAASFESLFRSNFSIVGPLPRVYRLNEEKTRGSSAKITDDQSVKLSEKFKRKEYVVKFESFFSGKRRVIVNLSK